MAILLKCETSFLTILSLINHERSGRGLPSPDLQLILILSLTSYWTSVPSIFKFSCGKAFFGVNWKSFKLILVYFVFHSISHCVYAVIKASVRHAFIKLTVILISCPFDCQPLHYRERDSLLIKSRSGIQLNVIILYKIISHIGITIASIIQIN